MGEDWIRDGKGSVGRIEVVLACKEIKEFNLPIVGVNCDGCHCCDCIVSGVCC